MTSCTWHWASLASLSSSPRPGPPRRGTLELREDKEARLSEGTGEIERGDVYRSGGQGSRTVRGGVPLARRRADPPVGDARALRGVVGLRDVLPCDRRCPTA